MSTFDLYHVGLKASYWFERCVYLVGVVVSVWGWRLSRKAGYLIFAVSFIFAAGTLSILPTVNRKIQRQFFRQHPLSQETLQEYQHESDALFRKYYSADPPHTIVSKSVWIPSIALVAGLWLLAMREPRKDAEPNAGGNAAPPRASA